MRRLGVAYLSLRSFGLHSGSGVLHTMRTFEDRIIIFLSLLVLLLDSLFNGVQHLIVSGVALGHQVLMVSRDTPCSKELLEHLVHPKSRTLPNRLPKELRL